MLLDVEFQGKGIAIFRATGGDLHANSLPRLNELSEMMERQGKSGIILELSGLRRVSAGGLAALVELVSLRRRQAVAVCNPPEKLTQLIENLGLYRGLPIFKDLNTALRSTDMRRCQLRGLRALVLCDPSPRGALDKLGAVEMLDILGRPLVHRVLERLSDYGCRVAYLNPTRDVSKIANYFSGERVMDQCQFFLGPEIGSAASELGVVLRRLLASQVSVDDDLLIVKSDQLNGADLGAFLDHHHSEQADVTILQNQEGRDTRLSEVDPFADPSAVILRSGLIKGLPSEGCQSLEDLTSALRRQHRRVVIYRSERRTLQVSSVKSYFHMLTTLMTAPLNGMSPVAQATNKGVWQATGAQIVRGAQVDGPVFIGADAVVSRHARVIGPVVIGEGVSIPAKTLIRNSIVLPGAQIAQGSLIDGKLVGKSFEMSLTAKELPEGILPMRPEAQPVELPEKKEKLA